MVEAESETVLPSKNKLLRILGLGFGLAVVVGGTIGVSIFRLPGPTANLLGNTWLILAIWTVGGAFTLLNANYTAELATMIPKAGGPYVYAHYAYGNFAGFVVGWSDWLGNVASVAFLPIAFAEYAIALFAPSFTGVTSVALALLLLLAFLNWVGLRAGSGTQKLTSFLKAIGLLAFVVACFALGGRHSSINAEQTTPAASAGPFAPLVAIVLSFQLILGAYGGWNSVIYFAEEDKNPGYNIPRSLHAGVLSVIGIYLLVNVALLYVVPLPQLASSKLAAADAMRAIFGAWGGQIVTGLALLSIIAIVNAILMFTPRTLYALGRDGLFSARAITVNQGGTPVVALAVTVLVAAILIIFGTFEKLMANYAFYAVANNIVLISALFGLRKRAPDLPRPFRTWAYPFAPLAVLVISVALVAGFIVSDPRDSTYALILLAASYPIYRLIKTKPVEQQTRIKKDETDRRLFFD